MPRRSSATSYFDAERWDDAIKWYERALELDPQNADASTDLGVSYYYSNKPTEALAQFEKSLRNQSDSHEDAAQQGHRAGIRQAGPRRRAASEWQKVVDVAPDSPEGQAARRALEA